MDLQVVDAVGRVTLVCARVAAGLKWQNQRDFPTATLVNNCKLHRFAMKQGLLDGSGSGTFDGLAEEFGRTMKIQQKAILDVQNMGAGGERAQPPFSSLCSVRSPAGALTRLCLSLSLCLSDSLSQPAQTVATPRLRTSTAR